MSAVIRCRHDSAARSPSCLQCFAPSANAGLQFPIFQGRIHGTWGDHDLVFARVMYMIHLLPA